MFGATKLIFPISVLDECTLAYHPVLAGILSQTNNHMTQVLLSSQSIQKTLQNIAHDISPKNQQKWKGRILDNAGNYDLYRDIHSPVSKKWTNNLYVI